MQTRYPKLDVTDEESVRKLASSIQQEHQGVDVQINNAGLNIQLPASGARNYDDQKKFMDVNFWGTLRMCQTFLALMKSGGRLVNLSLVASELKHYSEASKARLSDDRMTLEDSERIPSDFEVCKTLV